MLRYFTTKVFLALVTLSLATPELESHYDRVQATFEISKIPEPAPLPYSFDRQLTILETSRLAVLTMPSKADFMNAGENRKQNLRSLKLPVSVRQSGLTGDACTSSKECSGSRICSTGTAAGSRRCVPTGGLQKCVTDASCETGEICVTMSQTDRRVCFSQEAARNMDTESTSTQSGPSSSKNGLTGDKCSSDADCVGSRVCINFLDDLRCVPQAGPRGCKDDDDCPFEGCLTIFDTGNRFCASEGFAREIDAQITVEITVQGSSPPPTKPSSSQSSSSTVDTPTAPDADADSDGVGPDDPQGNDSRNEPCVGINWVRHVPEEELLFKHARLARVLCDMNESCATAGHMVRYRGRGMMMKSYCEITGCEGRVMLVNSFRYKPGLVMESWSDGLVFTAFSARYGTRAEESVLTAAMGLGL